MILRTRLREWINFALKARNLSKYGLSARLRRQPKGLHVKQLNDHLARDIGLSDRERARHKLTYPSQTHHHPRG